MKTTKLLCFLVLSLFVSGLNSQSLNIGNFTSLKVNKGVIYVAGQSGIAAVKPDMSVIWEKQLPLTTVRLIEVSDNSIALSSYIFAGREGKLFSSFSSLWDKITLTDNMVSLMSLNGDNLWTTKLAGNSKLSAPAIGNGMIVLSSNDSLYIFDSNTGVIKSQTYNNEKFIL